MGRWRSPWTLALVVVVLSGCSQKPGPTKTAFLTPEPDAAVTLSFDRGTETIGARFQGSGLAPGARYALELRAGTCLKPGSLMFTFGSITSSPTGTADQRVDATRSAPGIPRGIHIDLRLLAAAGSAAAPVLSACTDVPAMSPTRSLRFFPPPRLRAGGSFTATFKDARTLSIQVGLVGLRSGSVHAIGVYAGTCEAQGALDTPIADVEARADGSASASKVVHVSSTTGSMYVGIRSGASSASGAAQANPIDTRLVLCGDLPARPKKT